MIVSYMRIKITGLSECLITKMTLEWLFIRMQTDVIAQISRLRERPIAVRTLKGALARVDPHVINQIARLGEALRAHFAPVRFVARVGAHVYAQIAARVEGFQAELTGQGVVRVSLNALVFLQVGLQATEILFAHWTLLEGHGLSFEETVGVFGLGGLFFRYETYSLSG